MSAMKLGAPLFFLTPSYNNRTPLNILVLGLNLLKCRLRLAGMSRQLQDDVLELEMSCATAIDILNNLLTHEKLKGGLQQLEHTFELPIFL